MKIAVIDEGVMPVFKDELNIVEDLMVNNEYSVVNRSEENQIITDHGYNVCKIINIYTQEVEIISIRIFNTLEMKTSIEALIAAFQYCLDKRVPIIHLSGGTINLFDDYLLRDVIKNIVSNNQIIVAAHSNNKGLSFPAFYPGVFSARAYELSNSYDDVKNRWGYSLTSISKHKININENLNYVTQIANSYAAPVLTANIYNNIKSNGDKNIKRILSNIGIDNNVFLCELPYFLDKVTIINFCSEVILEEILSFEVRNIYDDIVFTLDSEDYIFIPHNNKENNTKKLREFLNLLPVNHNRIRIFYVGVVDSSIESIMTSYPFEFWLLPSDDVYPICASTTDLNDCGTIYFKGKKELVYSIMTKLRDDFLEDGFNCFAISDYLEAVLYDIYYFENLTNSVRRQQLEYVLEPDVELVYTKTEEYIETENSMLIECMKEEDIVKLIIRSKKIKEEIYIWEKEDINKLFQKIINIE